MQLSAVGRGAAQAESTLRELAALNQMLSMQARRPPCGVME